VAPTVPVIIDRAGSAVNGRSVALKPITRKGYAHIKRRWKKGDRVEFNLPMPIERVEAHPNVRQDAGKVAVQRGPIVYCLEQVDNGPNLHDIVLPAKAKLRAKFEPKLLGGVCVITGKAKRRHAKDWGDELYSADASKQTPTTIKAVPYAPWANRKPGEMRVWLNAR